MYMSIRHIMVANDLGLHVHVHANYSRLFTAKKLQMLVFKTDKPV